VSALLPWLNNIFNIGKERKDQMFWRKERLKMGEDEQTIRREDMIVERMNRVCPNSSETGNNLKVVEQVNKFEHLKVREI
jgi:hypothetical protein